MSSCNDDAGDHIHKDGELAVGPLVLVLATLSREQWLKCARGPNSLPA